MKKFVNIRVKGSVSSITLAFEAPLVIWETIPDLIQFLEFIPD